MDWEDCVSNGIVTLRCLPLIFKNLADFLFSISAIVAVFFIMFSGLKLLISGGDPTRVSEAHKSLTYTMIGLAVVILSFTIIKIVSYITGAQCLTFFSWNSCT